MPFVKLDCGILNSTLWFERECREVFITALLMAEPREFFEPIPQLETRSLNETGFVAPPGWYGFVEAAGVGILTRARVSDEKGFEALERLASPEAESRSRDFEGRRMIRIDGGYIILNYMRYRDRDYTSAERSARYRKRLKDRASHRDVTPSHRDITQAEAEAEIRDQKENKREKKQEPRPLSTNLHAKPSNLINGHQQREHGSHAWCSYPDRDGFCIPASYHRKILGKSQKPEPEVFAFYQTTIRKYQGLPIGDPLFTFWDNEVAAWLGLVTSTPKAKKGISDADRKALEAKYA